MCFHMDLCASILLSIWVNSLELFLWWFHFHFLCLLLEFLFFGCGMVLQILYFSSPTFHLFVLLPNSLKLVIFYSNPSTEFFILLFIFNLQGFHFFFFFWSPSVLFFFPIKVLFFSFINAPSFYLRILIITLKVFLSLYCLFKFLKFPYGLTYFPFWSFL